MAPDVRQLRIYETGVSKPSPDRTAQLARLLCLKPSDVSASERGAARKAVDRPRSIAAKQAASRGDNAKALSRDEGAVLDALRVVPAAERRCVVTLLALLLSVGLSARAPVRGVAAVGKWPAGAPIRG